MKSLIAEIQQLYDECSNLKEKWSLSLNEIYLHAYLTNAYLHEKKFKEARMEIDFAKNRLVQYTAQSKNTAEFIELYIKLLEGKYAYYQKDFDKCERIFKEVEKNSSEKNYTETLIESDIFLSLCAYEKKAYKDALTYAEKVLNSKVEVLDCVDYKEVALEQALFSSQKLGATTKFEQYSKMYHDLNSRLNVNKKRLALNKSIINYENQELVEGVEAKTKRHLYLLIAIFISLLVGSFIFFNWRNKKNTTRLKENVSQKLQEEFTNPIVAETIKSTPEPEQLSEEIVKKVMDKLKTFEDKNLFTKTKITIAYLANYADINTVTLSKIINTQKGCNFNDYINGLRINYIIEKIKDNPAYLNYKLSYLAEECGFLSHSAFSKSFKKHTNISPTAFISSLKEKS